MIKSLLLTCVALVMAASAWAHGEPIAKRGGILKQVDDLAFELVVRDDKIDLYIYDGPEEISSEGMSGVLTIVTEAERTKTELHSAGINRLRATDVTAAGGSRVVAIVRMSDGTSLAVEFAVP